MPSFFQGAAGTKDRLFVDIARGNRPYLRKARRFIELMWSTCGHFVDENAPVRAGSDFHAVWWELYLAYALFRAGVSLVPSNDRLRNMGNGRPDLLADNPRVWIEAIMPQPGTGADGLVDSSGQGVFDVPLDQFVLRLTSAIREKSDKMERYVTNGTVPTSDATLVAVSGGRLPFRFQDYPIPNIVRAVCGVGFIGVDLDVRSGQRLGTHVDFRDHIQKKSKSLVSTDLFLQPESAHVSAVLYSSSDCVNYPRRPGSEFILVHNPKARVALPSSWLPAGAQYWLNGSTIRVEVARAQTP